jgi:hypothetical protein
MAEHLLSETIVYALTMTDAAGHGQVRRRSSPAGLTADGRQTKSVDEVSSASGRRHVAGRTQANGEFFVAADAA